MTRKTALGTRLPAGLVGLICCGALLSACGGSSTNVSNGSFVSWCAKTSGGTSSECRCMQRKLVAGGDGGIDYTRNFNSLSTSQQLAVRGAATACGITSNLSPPSRQGTTT